MVSDDELEPPTVSELRHRVRELIEAEARGGHHPLRKREKHRAYYCLTGEKLGDATNGEVSYRLIDLLETTYDLDDIRDEPGRDPWDYGGPFSKAEQRALVDALEAEAADADTEETEGEPDA